MSSLVLQTGSTRARRRISVSQLLVSFTKHANIQENDLPVGKVRMDSISGGISICPC